EGGQGTLTLSQNVTIDGTGAAVTVEGGKTAFSSTNTQPFVVNGGVTATLENLTINNGFGGGGGGIRNAGTLTVNNCAPTGNEALGFGGGVMNDRPGTLTLSNCTLSGNFAGDGGGIAILGTLTVSNCTLSGNSAYIAADGVFIDHATA